jgi:hypothetical protein
MVGSEWGRVKIVNGSSLITARKVICVSRVGDVHSPTVILNGATFIVAVVGLIGGDYALIDVKRTLIVDDAFGSAGCIFESIGNGEVVQIKMSIYGNIEYSRLMDIPEDNDACRTCDREVVGDSRKLVIEQDCALHCKGDRVGASLVCGSQNGFAQGAIVAQALARRGIVKAGYYKVWAGLNNIRPCRSIGRDQQ